MSEYSNKESRKLVGELYPILEDKYGNIIDGLHRYKDYPDWRRETLDWVDDKTKLTLARMDANWNRRKITAKEKTKWLDGLCKANPKWKGRFGSFVSALIKVTGKSKRTIERHLSKKYQRENYSMCHNGTYLIKPVIKFGDFRELVQEIDDNSIDLILTDPPYAKEYLELWGVLSREAKRVLKPSAFLITYSGQTYLPQVINALSQHLLYYWLGMLYHKGVTSQAHHRNMWNRAKPILFFQKSPFRKQESWIEDVVESDKPDKDYHEWGQNIKPLLYLIGNFTKEGERVLDPMMGGGATVEASLRLKRNIIAFENDKESYDLVMARFKNDKG